MYLINYRLFRYFNAKNIGYFFGNYLIHNASTKVETSLKFDIQIINMPETVVSIDRQW